MSEKITRYAELSATSLAIFAGFGPEVWVAAPFMSRRQLHAVSYLCPSLVAAVHVNTGYCCFQPCLPSASASSDDFKPHLKRN